MIVWIIGLAGSGKTTIGRRVYEILRGRRPAIVFLDGDHFRAIMGEDLGHTVEDRRRNGWRMARMCAFLDAQGIDVICCILSLFKEQRDWNRVTFSEYFEVFLDVSMGELIRRDQKGLYSAAVAGRISHVAGVDIPFDRPQSSDLIIDNNLIVSDLNPLIERIVAGIIGKMEPRGCP